MFCHVSTARLSPNHWWASSWTTTPSFGWLGPKKNGEYVGRVWFSSANPTSTLSTIPPAAENGYGPNVSASQPMISGWRSNDCWAPVPTPGIAGISVATTQLFWLGALPSGAGPTTQPSRTLPSFSKPVEPAPVDTTTLSIATPWPWTKPSLAYEIETSTWRGAPPASGSATDQCSQPSDAPLTAFQTPVVPDGVQRRKSSLGSAGSPGSAMNGVT